MTQTRGDDAAAGPPAGPAEERILALDVGEKRIGLAVSDPLEITAQGLGVVVRQGGEADLVRLQEMVRAYRIKQVVVGLPRHLDGRPGRQAQEIMVLARALGERLGAEVVAWDERFTTVEAERVLIEADLSRRRRRQVVDQLAAVLILQGYLEWRHSGH